MSYVAEREDAAETAREKRRGRLPRTHPSRAARRAVSARLLALSLAGGVTTLAYAAAIAYALGSGLGWLGAALAVLLGAGLGLGFGLVLGARRR